MAGQAKDAVAMKPQKSKLKTMLSFSKRMKTSNKKSPLLGAIEKGDTSLLYELCRHGCDVNAKDKDGLTALMNATRCGQKQMVLSLCAMSADVNASDNNGRTALHYSVVFNSPDVVKTLICFHADVNVQDEDNMTCLHFALSLGHTEIIKMLLRAGASLTLTDKRGRTPEDAAIQTHTHEIQNLLREIKLKDNSQSSNMAPLASFPQQNFQNGEVSETKQDNNNGECVAGDTHYEIMCDYSGTDPLEQENASAPAQPDTEKASLQLSSRHRATIPGKPPPDIGTTDACCKMSATTSIFSKEIAQATAVDESKDAELYENLYSHIYTNIPQPFSPQQTEIKSSTRSQRDPTPVTPPSRIQSRVQISSGELVTGTVMPVYNYEKPSLPSLKEHGPLLPPPRIPPRLQTIPAEETPSPKTATSACSIRPPSSSRQAYVSSSPPMPPNEHCPLTWPRKTTRVQRTTWLSPSSEEEITDLNDEDDANSPLTRDILMPLSGSPSRAARQEVLANPRAVVTAPDSQDPASYVYENVMTVRRHNHIQSRHHGHRNSAPLMPIPRPRKTKPWPRPVSTPELSSVLTTALEDLDGKNMLRMNRASSFTSKDVNKQILDQVSRALTGVIIGQDNSPQDRASEVCVGSHSEQDSRKTSDYNINIELHVKKPKFVAVHSLMNLRYDASDDADAGISRQEDVHEEI